eukprot:s1496_g10.t1
MAEELDLEHHAEEESRRFQRRAAELRANATAFTKVSSQRALRASAAAGETKAKELLDAMVAIEDKAAEAEAQAAALRRRAQAELRQWLSCRMEVDHIQQAGRGILKHRQGCHGVKGKRRMRVSETLPLKGEKLGKNAAWFS